VLSVLRTLGWLACVIYSTVPAFWLLIHPFAAFWRRQSLSPFAILIPVWLSLWALLAILTAPWRYAPVYDTPLAWLPAVLLFAGGLWLYRKAGAHFNLKQLGGLPELQPNNEQRLVTSGIRERLRHPVYLGHLLEMLAWSVGTGLWVCFALTTFAMLTGTVMIRMEDAELERRFGADYRQYRARVPAVLPRL
jgi:protein-S-isoprenylcysteine O-methyltransferase Ste14